MIATVQTRNPEFDSDIEWLSEEPAICQLAGVDPQTFTATWTAEVDLVSPRPLTTPPAGDNIRVQIEEFEKLSADPLPGETTLGTAKRLVYADHFYV